MNFGRPKPWKRPPPLVAKADTRMQFDKGPSRSAAHLAKVRQQPCLACQPGSQTTKSRSHHVRCLGLRGNRTTGVRKSDYLTAPLCDWHHTDAPSALHKGDEASWWVANGIDVAQWIANFSPEGREAVARINEQEAA